MFAAKNHTIKFRSMVYAEPEHYIYAIISCNLQIDGLAPLLLKSSTPMVPQGRPHCMVGPNLSLVPI